MVFLHNYNQNMSTNSYKSIVNDLTIENERILKDLNECHKRIDFLQKFIINYRKILVHFSHKCVCNQSNDIINSIKSIEFQYKELFFDDDNEEQRQSLLNRRNQSIEDNDDKSEQRYDGNREEDEEDVEESDIDSEEQINERFDNNVDENDDNSVLVFNKSNNTIIKKSYDNIDTNNEFIINSFVIKKAEDLMNETIDKVVNKSKDLISDETTYICVENTAKESVNNSNYKKKIRKQTVFSGITKETVYLEPELNEQTILLPIPSLNFGNVQHFIAKVDPKPNEIKNSKEVKISDIFTKRKVNEQNTEENNLKIISIIDGKVETLISDPIWSSHSLKSSKKYFDIFNALIEELKSGRIESFIDPKHNSIKVFLRNYEPNDRQKGPEIVFKCDYTDCQYESNCKKYIRSHVLRHEKDKTFVCNFCREEFDSKMSFIEHRIKVHNIDENRLFKCDFPDCEYKTTIKQSMELHSVRHQTERTVRCDVIGCDSFFKSMAQMKSHRKTVHVLKDFECEWPGCGASFKTRPALKTHLMSHTGENRTVSKIREVIKSGNYVSTVDKNNDIFSVIRQQIISEIDGKMEIGPKLGYKCNYTDCRFVCVLPHLISQHITTHSIGKTFTCDLCDKTFGLRKYWTQHQKNVHNINNSCPLLTCEYSDCNYQTRNVFSFKSHSLRHRTETPFKCDQNGCEKRFKTRVCLKQHMIYCHTKVKPFVCEFTGCESAFKMKTNLSRHMRSHSKTKHDYRCDRCSNTFEYKTLLNKHIKDKH